MDGFQSFDLPTKIIFAVFFICISPVIVFFMSVILSYYIAVDMIRIGKIKYKKIKGRIKK